MTVRAVIGLRVAICVIVVTLCLAPGQGVAEDAAIGGEIVAWPSVEGPAVPNDADENKPKKPGETAAETNTREAMCLMIESAARAEDLPLEFFARVIWQESRFQVRCGGTGDAQRPARAGYRAIHAGDRHRTPAARSRSIRCRRCRNPPNSSTNCAASSAISGWRPPPTMPGPGGCRNGSPARAACRRRRGNYVAVITGSTVDDWAAAGKTGKMPDRAPTSSCRELMALLRRAPNPFVTQLEQHVKLSEAQAWGVQLAAGFSRDKAMAMYARAIKRLSAVIGGRDPSLLSTMMRSRGSRTFYQVRIGADTRPAADDLCNRIRRAGGACFVLRNFRG